MTNKFYELKNKSDGNVSLYVYGEIVSGDKWEDSDVTIKDFQNLLDSLDSNVRTLNMYVSSPGGSVTTTIAMIAQLERLKKKKVTINAYVDGVAASAASFLIMVADNIYAYSSSFLMVHKPMANAIWSNSNEMRDVADWLDKMEDNTCIPIYMKKATGNLSEEKLRQMLTDETWLTSTEMAEFFNITILDEVKDAVACLNLELLNSYKNVPQSLTAIKNKQDDSTPSVTAQEMKERQNIADEAKAGADFMKTLLGGFIK